MSQLKNYCSSNLGDSSEIQKSALIGKEVPFPN